MNWAGDLVQKFVSRRDTVLDLGCGAMQAILDVNPNYPPTKLKCKMIVGCDIYRACLEKIKSENRVHVLQLDLRMNLPFSAKSFDVVLMLDTIEHFFYVEACRLIERAARIAVKRVIVLTPTKFHSNIERSRSNPHLLHKCFVSAKDLEERGFATWFPSVEGRPFLYTFAVKEMRINEG